MIYLNQIKVIPNKQVIGKYFVKLTLIDDGSSSK